MIDQDIEAGAAHVGGDVTQKIALGVAYNGSEFEGWQKQPHGRTVQDLLEAALSEINGSPVDLVCAGRTDTGVHARQQVVHFETSAERPLVAWVKGVNSQLPKTVAVQGAQIVPQEFHARFSAKSRTYRYYFYTARSPDPFKQQMSWIHYPLNLRKMLEAGQCLLGTHDFSSFRAGQCQAKSPIRTLMRLEMHPLQDYAYVELQGNAFLHHMVRNIMGCLFEVGLGRKPVEWVAEILALKSRVHAARTYPSQGLTLWEVEYPEAFRIGDLFKPSFPFQDLTT
ncbi:MAG: tRNA pseudouridine(38-40) synthase TruA [Limnobacter sp.]|nr:tRNA pseudouridine(38-40) synthase TruA [Limnobacter sp.]